MKKYRVFLEIGERLHESENHADFHSIDNSEARILTLWRKTGEKGRKVAAAFRDWKYFLIDDET